MTQNNIVSFDDEKLILVDSENNIRGYKDKLECHLGDGDLHRAFSVFIFNDTKELLLQQRSSDKMLWPLIWSNSCCSHPRKGEDFEQATHRRLKEELGIDTDLKYLFRFEYQARYFDIGSEHELCSVYIGKSNQSVKVNPTEIADWKYIPIDTINDEFAKYPDMYSPWFKMEWARIQQDFVDDVYML
jgi:isopentenyl-diphosphate delta-isomerase